MSVNCNKYESLSKNTNDNLNILIMQLVSEQKFN